MNRRLIVHSEAETEILQALSWYGERSRVAARAFVQELTNMVTLATRSPELAPNLWKHTADSFSEVPVQPCLPNERRND